MMFVQQAVKEITKRFKRHIMDQKIGLFHLSTGVCLCKAEFGVQNLKVAAQHFNSAVRMGWTQGHYYLGVLLKCGIGLEKCDITARNVFLQGTDAGIAAVMSELGRCNGEGISVERDSSNREELVKRIVQLSNSLGYALNAYYNLHGYNVPVNPSCGFKWRRRLPRVTENRTISLNAISTESVRNEIRQKPSD